MAEPFYSPEFDDGYDAFKQGGRINPYLANEPVRRNEWWRGYRTAEWEMKEPARAGEAHLSPPDRSHDKEVMRQCWIL